MLTHDAEGKVKPPEIGEIWGKAGSSRFWERVAGIQENKDSSILEVITETWGDGRRVTHSWWEWTAAIKSGRRVRICFSEQSPNLNRDFAGSPKQASNAVAEWINTLEVGHVVAVTGENGRCAGGDPGEVVCFVDLGSFGGFDDRLVRVRMADGSTVDFHTSNGQEAVSGTEARRIGPASHLASA